MSALDGKVALVTGGGSGIGRAVVEAFVAEGARVAVLERSAQRCAQLESALGASVRAIAGDGTLLADNERAVDGALAAFGALDVLVTCVGVWDFMVGLVDLPAERLSDAFDEALSTNVKSHLLAVKASTPALLEARGCIVVTLSNAAFHPGGGGPLYTCSKFALRGLVTELAYELAPRVRVNGVAPGGTLTPLAGLTALGQAGMALSELPGAAELMRAGTPLQHVAEPADHAGAYVYLASSRAPAVTGTIVQSDGGIGVRGIGKA